MFVQLTFTGSRFDSNTLPLDVMRDLKAYETLLIDLAKYLFLKDHPEKTRAPKNFSNVRLDIAKLEAGSTKPALVLVSTAVASGILPAIAENQYYDKARELIAQRIAASESVEVEDFPEKFLHHFNKLGFSLKEGETMEHPLQGSDRAAILNPEKRKKTCLDWRQRYL